ncbi:NUDIX hydrolase [Actinopolymorpha sp. NPDC004070]|uniref:NUDIX hydrolase n=1 Tax=Actinopolymorpha sp. NPDC004070 TaxID=3154548 RepID=UPI0033A86577
MTTIEPPDGHWSLRLPRKREASGALFFDSAGRVLVVKPTYTDGWDYPGGVVDANEAPYAAAAREVKEELGLTRPLGRLLVVDWEPRTEAIPIEGLMTVFDGGVLTPEEIASITLQESELGAFDFWSIRQVREMRPALYGRRISAAMRARKTGAVAYLENGYPPVSF